jgi:hypothetical protein
MKPVDWKKFAAGTMAMLNLKITPEQQTEWDGKVAKGTKKLNCNKEIGEMVLRRVTEQRQNPVRDPEIQRWLEEYSNDPQ